MHEYFRNWSPMSQLEGEPGNSVLKDYFPEMSPNIDINCLHRLRNHRWFPSLHSLLFGAKFSIHGLNGWIPDVIFSAPLVSLATFSAVFQARSAFPPHSC